MLVILSAIIVLRKMQQRCWIYSSCHGSLLFYHTVYHRSQPFDSFVFARIFEAFGLRQMAAWRFVLFMNGKAWSFRMKPVPLRSTRRLPQNRPLPAKAGLVQALGVLLTQSSSAVAPQ